MSRHVHLIVVLVVATVAAGALALSSTTPVSADHCDSIADGQDRALCSRTPHSTPDLEAQNECRERGGIYRDGSCLPSFTDMQSGPFIATQVSGKVLDHQLYYYAIACGANVDIDKLPEDELQAWEWYYTGNSFRDSVVGIGDWVGGLYDKIPKVGGILKYQAGIYLLANELRGEGAARGDMYKNSVAACEEGKWLQEAYGRYGLTEPYDTFCSHDFAYSRHGGGLGKGGTKQQCLDSRGQGDFDASGSKSEQAAAVQKVLDATQKGRERKGLTPPEEYVRQIRTFIQGCDPTFVRDYEPRGGAENDKKAFKVPIVTQNALLGHVYATTDKTDENTELILVATRSGGYQKTTCGKAAAEARKHAEAYRKWLERNETAAGNTVGSSEGTDGDHETSCNVDGVGWIVCPLIIFMADLNDKAFGFLADKFLAVSPDLTTAATTKTAWESFRNVANAMFVIAALIIIYSQLTGAGLSNYNIKRLLPRLLIIAVAVNVSYWLTLAAVDISNIVGRGVFDLFSTVPVNDLNAPNVVTGSDLSWKQVAVAILAGTVAVAVGLVLLLSLGGAGLLALLLIILIVVGRQAIIVLLIVLAPLAFVAYLLPNTEQWFKKWWQLFYALLLVFPIIGLIFGASVMASQILGGLPGWEMKIIALGVAVIPLFAVPMALKSALSATGTLGATLRGWSDKADKRAGKRFGKSAVGGMLKHRQKRADERSARIASGSYRGRGGRANPRNWRSNMNRRLNDSGAFNRLTQGYGAERDLGRQAQERGDQKDTIAMFGGDYELAQAWANHGGGALQAGHGLTESQAAQYNRMRAAGHHQKSASHIATAQFLAETGQGNGAQISNALAAAERTGASATDVASARETAIGTARANGRGDTVAEMRHAQGNANFTNAAGGVDYAAGWAETNLSKAHRAGLSAGSGGRQGFVDRISGDRDAARQALVGFDQMEARARNLVEGDIVAAAQAHQYNETGAAPTISNVQDAKDYFDVR